MSVFAGVSVVALGLAGLLAPALSGTVIPAAPPCTPATPGSGAVSGGTLCLSVTQQTNASALLPGHDAGFTIGVWLAGQQASPSPSPAPTDTATPAPSPSSALSAASVTVTLTAPAGGPVPQFLSCPAAVSNGTCPLGTLTAGSPASTITADVAIPATATAGQTITFTITTATATPGIGTPASTQSFTVAAPPAPPSPSATPPTRTTSPPAPASSPAATAAALATGAGATLPAGLSTPTAGPSIAALGPLPGSVTTTPLASFPVVTPAASQLPLPAANPRPVPLAHVSAQFPLIGNRLGLQFGGIALAAALVSLGTAWVTLRRRPRPGSAPARGQRRS